MAAPDTPVKQLVAFDETGHTGANLLDSDQPVFVLASVLLSDADTANMLGDGEVEMKFATLKRSAAGRRRIIEVLNSPLLSADRFLVMGIHKPFMIVAKIVDLLVETLAHEEGIDLYKRGANLALANMLHFCLPVFLGSEMFELLKAKFIAMVREPSSVSIEAFYDLLRQIYTDNQDKEYAIDIAMLLATKSVADEYSHLWGDHHLDPSIPAFVTHASTWTERLGKPFTIIHDQSKPIEISKQF